MCPDVTVGMKPSLITDQLRYHVLTRNTGVIMATQTHLLSESPIAETGSSMEGRLETVFSEKIQFQVLGSLPK